MPAFSCPSCDHAPVDVVEFTDDARMRLHCGSCDHAWIHPPAEPAATVAAPTPAASREPARRPAPAARPRAQAATTVTARFPTADDVSDAARARLVELKGRFLRLRPRPDPETAEHVRFYQLAFSEQGLPHTLPADLRGFATSAIGTYPGSLSGFNAAWNKLGDRAAAERVRDVVGHLLHGDVEPIEDRMQSLIDPGGRGMTGFREPLLTRTLCAWFPDRFLPILTYTSAAGGKKEIAAAVLDLELPSPTSTWPTARLAFRSNDLLLALCGPGFVDVAHTAEFLWWAKDQPR